MDKKKLITKQIVADRCFSGCYVLSDFINMANALIEKYGDVNVDLESGYNSITTYLTIDREETDEELSRRVKLESKMKSDSEARKRKMYEKLKKELGE